MFCSPRLSTGGEGGMRLKNWPQLPQRIIVTQDGGWTMRKSMALTLTLLVTGCVRVDPAAICDGSRQARAEHAAALAVDGGERSVMTGVALMQAIDAGCGATPTEG